MEKSGFRLEEVEKKNPFKVPENYFDTLGTRVTNKIEIEDEGSGSGKVSLIKILRPLLGLAASFVAIFGLFYLTNKIVPINKFQNSSTNTQSFNDSYLYSQVDDATLLDIILNEETPSTVDLNNSEIEEILIAYIPDYYIYENN